MRIRLLLSLTCAISVLIGCASPRLTPEEKARIEARRAEAAAQIRQEKEAFETSVAARMAADPNAPPRVPDPGYPAARCINPSLRDTAAAVSFPSFGVAYGGVVCDNTDAGLKILAWREWYCRGLESDSTRVRDCVTAWWRNGIQHKVGAPGMYRYGGHGGSVSQKTEFTRNPRSDSIKFEPATWQPGITAAHLIPDRLVLVANGKRQPIRIAWAYKVEVQRGSVLFGGIHTYYVLDGDWAEPRVDRTLTPVPEFVVSVRQGAEPIHDHVFPRLFQFATNRGARIYAGTPQGPQDNFTKWGLRSVPQKAEPLPDQSSATPGYRLWRITPAQPLTRGQYGLRKESTGDGYLFFPFGVD